MTSVDTILYQAKQKSEAESARRCTVSGDDSFYCSGESNNSTSPTSSITSSGSFGNESDEGFPRRVSEESTRNKATKNLEKSVVLFRTIKREPEDKNCDLIPMDLSCHKRTSSNKTCKPANKDKNNLVVKPEPVDDYPNFAKSRPAQFKPSATFEKTVAPTAQPPTTFASSMFSWPYFPTPITSNGLPAFPPSYLAGKYFHPGLFLPATGNAPTSCSSVPTTNSLNYAAGNSMLTGLHQLTAANHLQPPLLQALLSPQTAAQGSTVAENNSKNPHHTSNTNIYHSTSSPRNFESDPSLLTEFAKVFSS
uniref:Uncharacterized protein n=1 Tax=Ciona savignyi TaxID=51511 RepID=H2ZGI6_CIOSA